MPETFQQTRGFSVINLIIIVAVVGIVLAVAVPAQIRARQIDHARTCQENLARIDAAVEAYRLHHKAGSDAAVPADINVLVEPDTQGYLDHAPHCPNGGSYTITSRGPACSVDANARAAYAPHIKTVAIPKP